MELTNTVDLMLSTDSKERFVAEYLQLKIRYYHLTDLLAKYKKGNLDYNHNHDFSLLIIQAKHMWNYLNILEMRAKSEGIDTTQYEH